MPKKNLDSLSKSTPAGSTGTPPAKDVAAPVVVSSPMSTPPETPAPAVVSAPESTPAAEQAPVAAPAPTPTSTPTPTPTAQPDPFMAGEKVENDYDTLFPEPSVIIESPPAWIWWLVLLAASVIVGLVGFRLLNHRLDNWLSVSSTPTPHATVPATVAPTATPTTTATPTPSSSPAPTATPSVTATPVATANASSVSLRVLNGTTVTGAAASAKTTLQKAGYTVRTIGNAKQQTYTTSYIYYKTGKLAEAQAVQAVLKSYSITLQEASNLADPDDLLVVIGAK